MEQINKKVYVLIVSDATGITAERVISAALVQFQELTPIYKRIPYVMTKEQIDEILAEAEKLDAIVIYSLVSEELRAYIQKQKRKRDVYTIDLLGPLLSRIGRQLNVIPVSRPGLYKGMAAESLRLSESIDFTLKHDDGQNIDTLSDADLIILGISRTSKTPTSLYLSCNNNLRVANFPIIPNEPPPEEIFNARTRKVGFTISPEKVALIRKKRFSYAGPGDYIDIESIRKELLYSHKIFRNIKGLQVIDVTNSSIEEISEQILAAH
jgi:regulator of PEP synthase PpsR (kinase-PPPase family)